MVSMKQRCGPDWRAPDDPPDDVPAAPNEKPPVSLRPAGSADGYGVGVVPRCLHCHCCCCYPYRRRRHCCCFDALMTWPWCKQNNNNDNSGEKAKSLSVTQQTNENRNRPTHDPFKMCHVMMSFSAVGGQASQPLPQQRHTHTRAR